MTDEKFLNEIKKVQEYYNQDSLQKRFSLLLTGETGSGKTFTTASTARKPVFIDSFDPGGTKCIRDLINRGLVIADTRWEHEDPYKPDKFQAWVDETKHRLSTRFYNNFGTYILDSASSWGDAAMNKQLESEKRPGLAPRFTKDYTPQKMEMINNLKRLMSLECDFILLGHLRMIEETAGVTKDGQEIKKVKYRFFTTGQAMITIPMQFDELWVIRGRENSSGVERYLITESQGTYIARSRLKANGLLAAEEKPDIKHILKKIGMPYEDKPIIK